MQRRFEHCTTCFGCPQRAPRLFQQQCCATGHQKPIFISTMVVLSPVRHDCKPVSAVLRPTPPPPPPHPLVSFILGLPVCVVSYTWLPFCRVHSRPIPKFSVVVALLALVECATYNRKCGSFPTDHPGFLNWFRKSITSFSVLTECGCRLGG